MPATVELLPYQKRWMADKSRYKIGLWSRQVGKTFVATLEIIDDVFANLVNGRRVTWIVLSAGERQAKEALESCKRHCSVYQLGFEAVEGESAQDGVTFKVQEIRFSNGSKVVSLPANPATVRGYSGNLYFDEACFWRDSDAIWQAAAPIATRGGFKVRMTSTPAGKSGIFYRIWTDQDSTWSKHKVTVHDAVAEGLNLDVDALKKAIGDELTWQTEYCLEFADAATAWLDYDLIASCEAPTAGRPEFYEPRAGQLCYIGNDIARKQHLWVAWVLEKVGDVLWTREVKTLKGASFAEQDQTLDELMRKYRVSRVAMDMTGMGMKPVEDAQRRHGEYRVEGVMFTAANKQTLATVGKQAFEDRKVRIPEGDAAIRADLHSLKRVTTAVGNIRFDSDGDTDGHSDRAWALFLAIYAASNPSAPIEYRAVGEAYGGVQAFEESAGGLLVPVRSVGFGSVGGGADMGGFDL